MEDRRQWVAALARILRLIIWVKTPKLIPEKTTLRHMPTYLTMIEMQWSTEEGAWIPTEIRTRVPRDRRKRDKFWEISGPVGKQYARIRWRRYK